MRQLTLPSLGQKVHSPQAEDNRVRPEDMPVHDWYRFVLSFPPHLVRDYLSRFLGSVEGAVILDPFCGTGTTLVEAQKLGGEAVGVDSNPVCQFAARVKTDWTPDPDGLVRHARAIGEATLAELKAAGIDDLTLRFPPTVEEMREFPPETQRLLIKHSISPKPLHKVLVLMEQMQRAGDSPYRDHERLALATALVRTIGNLRFGPEVGVGKLKEDVPAVPTWLARVERMAEDLRRLPRRAYRQARVLLGDARDLRGTIGEGTVDVVFTSPPYPNEKDYTRTTRMELVFLGFARNRAELRELKQRFVRSNTRGLYKGDADERWVQDHPSIVGLAEEIERRRVEMGKTSGFERNYARVVLNYFGGMKRHLANLRPLLKPGAWLAYVVGDQASFLRVEIRTGLLLAEIAESLGYETVAIDLFRERFSTATRSFLREEVVVLRWSGGVA